MGSRGLLVEAVAVLENHLDRARHCDSAVLQLKSYADLRAPEAQLTSSLELGANLCLINQEHVPLLFRLKQVPDIRR